MDRIFLQHLRRIHRSPVHINHTSHIEFLEQLGIPDPLWRLHRQFVLATQRETQRHSLLTGDDILHTHQIPDLNVITSHFAEVHKLQREIDLTVTDGVAAHVCTICGFAYDTVATLRRHLTQRHGHRTGPLKANDLTDFTAGVPTCSKCGAHFTTWYRLQYHAKYVCTLPNQDPSDLEHRMRVREFLQFGRALNFVALGQHPVLQMYFKQHCVLCGKFALTDRGMLQH